MNPRGFFLLTIVSIDFLLVPTAPAIEFHQNLVFVERDGEALKLDLACPPTGKMRPAVMLIHGGGWQEGHRSDHHENMRKIAEQGYVTASIDYRSSDKAKWPAQIEDVQTALRWMIEHAGEYEIDRERIGVLGASAGGHLALLVGCIPAESSNTPRLRSIANLYGPTDLHALAANQPVRGLLEGLVGTPLEEHVRVLQEASPVSYIDRTDPPVFTLHGTADSYVPFAQATKLHAQLEKSKIPNRLFSMQGAGHELGDDTEEGLQQLLAFMDAHLKVSDLPLVAYEDFEENTTRWHCTDREAWKLFSEDGRKWFGLTKNSAYQPKVRSPLNIALLSDVEVGNFVLDVDLRSTHEPYGHQDLCLFFGHQDTEHFYYVHIGREADAHANSVFLVNHQPRVSIAETRTQGTDWSKGWHRARIRRDVASGLIEVYFDDMQTPIMQATDTTFTHGRIGIGSFDDTGDFDAVRLWGERVSRP